MSNNFIFFMSNKSLIEFIIGTYDFSPKFRAELIEKTYVRIDEFCINGFDNIYRYISEFIMNYQIPYHERKGLRLDKPTTSEIKSTFHDIIENTNNLPTNHQGKNLRENISGLPIDEAISILDGHLDNSYLEIMRQLSCEDSTNGNLLLNRSPEELVKIAPEIQNRLEKLLVRFERNGKLVLPKRPIVYVKFGDSVSIRFRKRSYKGNPLAFFNKYPEVYDGKSRYKLSKLDGGLHQALWSAGQLELAIPEADTLQVERGKKLGSGELAFTKEQVDEIIAAYPIYGGNATEAARHTEYSKQSYINNWRAEGLEIKEPVACPFPQEKNEEILKTYKTHDKNAKKAGPYLGVAPNTVIKHWKAAGLKIRKQGSGKLKYHLN